MEKLNSATARLNSEIDKKIDIYAFAILLYELVTRDMAWSNLAPPGVIYNVKSGKRPPITEAELEDKSLRKKVKENNEIANLIVQSWDQDPQKRPSADSLHREFQDLFTQFSDNSIKTFPFS